MLVVFWEKKLLKARGRQRTDSTHVLAAVRTMNRLEFVTETLRAALNDLATNAPEWLRSSAPAERQQHYARRAEYRLRAGVEGGISQAVCRSGLRRARYRGLIKTHLQQGTTAAGLKVVRVVNHLSGLPLAPTRTSRFAGLYR